MSNHKHFTIGKLKWAIHEAATSELLSDGDKILYVSDVAIKPIKTAYNDSTQYNKKIELGSHFSFSLCDGAERHTTGERRGFGLSGRRDDERSFAWEWFVEDVPGRAKNQEEGELYFDTTKTPNGTEIHHMEFLTDISISVSRMTDHEPYSPIWRINIIKGSVILWPALVNGSMLM